MAKSKYQLEAESLKAKVESLSDEIVEMKDELEHADGKAEMLNKELDKANATINRYRATLEGNSNKIALLAEEGLIEAQEVGQSNNHATLIRLIGRLEGHLRGIVTACGCEFRVHAGNRQIPHQPRPEKRHGYVKVKNSDIGAESKARY